MTISSQALDALAAELGRDKLLTDPATLEASRQNALGLTREIAAVAFPESTEDVVRLVRAASRHRAALHALSRGRNLGYSDRLPTRDGAVVVDLGRMRKIRRLDTELGYAVVEAGVSQQQLYERLTASGAPFWMDATGAGLDSSLVGNSLEGGFGHTPRGDRRAQLTDLEVVLGDGTLLRTGTFPGFGPDLSGMFVQSSFGIVTAMRLPLLRAPARFVSFLALVREDHELAGLLDRLRELRQRGTLTSLVHVANALRSFVTTRPCPPEFADRPMRPEEARDLMSTAAVRVGAWSAIGGLYGEPEEVRARVRVLERALRGAAAVHFFDDARLGLLLRLTRAWPFRGLSFVQGLEKSLESFRHMHGLMRGVPSDEPLRNIGWRVSSPEELGLLWFAPTVEARGSEVTKVLRLTEPLFARHRFEMPVTFTLVTPERVVGAYSISFDRRKPDQVARAHALYEDLALSLAREGIYGYRTGILGMSGVRYPEPGKLATLRALKERFDPSGVLSPGRYGL